MISSYFPTEALLALFAVKAPRSTNLAVYPLQTSYARIEHFNN